MVQAFLMPYQIKVFYVLVLLIIKYMIKNINLQTQ
jgi:hypothetical protein